MVENWAIDYYETEPGKSPIVDFIDGLPTAKARAKIYRSLDLLAEYGFDLGKPHIKKISGKLWELRVVFASNQYRLFFIQMGEKRLKIVRAIHKKTQRIRKRDLDLALNRMKHCLGG